MINNQWRLLIIAGLAIALTGCNMNKDGGARTNTGMKQQAISNNRDGVTSRGWDNPRNNNLTPTHNNTKMEISNNIADAITAMDEIDTATVLITNQNAYVAVVLDNGTGYGANTDNRNTNRIGSKMTPNAIGNNATVNRLGRQGPGSDVDGITDDLKEAIAQKVRSVDPNVDNVYVSANADFVGRMRGYAQRFKNGQPISGMIIEFNTLIRRIFPTAK